MRVDDAHLVHIRARVGREGLGTILHCRHHVADLARHSPRSGNHPHGGPALAPTFQLTDGVAAHGKKVLEWDGPAPRLSTPREGLEEDIDLALALEHARRVLLLGVQVVRREARLRRAQNHADRTSRKPQRFGELVAARVHLSQHSPETNKSANQITGPPNGNAPLQSYTSLPGRMPGKYYWILQGGP